MDYVAKVSSLVAIADAIRKQTKLTEQLSFPNGFVSAVESIDADGAYNRGLVDGYEDGHEPITLMVTLSGAYANFTFPESHSLVLNAPNCTVFERAFAYTKNIKEIKLISNNEDIQAHFYATFFYSANLTLIDLTEFKPLISNFQSCFSGASKLTEIKGVLDLSISTVNAGFDTLPELVEIRFKPNSIYYSISLNSSPKLSATSIQSIIDGLADLTSGTAQTLSLHATVKAKLTEAQIAAITSKNWTLA